MGASIPFGIIVALCVAFLVAGVLLGYVFGYSAGIEATKDQVCAQLGILAGSACYE